jgi:hypothetical protein
MDAKDCCEIVKEFKIEESIFILFHNISFDGNEGGMHLKLEAFYTPTQEHEAKQFFNDLGVYYRVSKEYKEK